MFSHILEEKSSSICNNSCFPASIASLFACILIKDQKVRDAYSTIKNIFEVGIYPEVWEAAEKYTDEEKGYAFIKQFLKSDQLSIIKQKEDLLKLRPNQDEVLFSITATHVSLIFPAGDHFVCLEDPQKKLDGVDIPTDPSFYVVRIMIHDLDIEKITAQYEKYKKEIPSILRQSYFEHSDFKKWCMIGFDELHQIAPEVVEEKFKGLISRYSWQNIAKIIKLFPEKKAEIREIIFRNLSDCIIKPEDLTEILNLFPEERGYLYTHISQNPSIFAFDKYYSYITQHFKNLKTSLDALVLNLVFKDISQVVDHPNKAGELINRYLADKKRAEEVETIIFNDLTIFFKKSWQIDMLVELVKIFPHKKEQIFSFTIKNLHFFLQQSNAGTRDHKIEELRKIFPEITIPPLNTPAKKMFFEEKLERDPASNQDSVISPILSRYQML